MIFNYFLRVKSFQELRVQGPAGGDKDEKVNVLSFPLFNTLSLLPSTTLPLNPPIISDKKIFGVFQVLLNTAQRHGFENSIQFHEIVEEIVKTVSSILSMIHSHKKAENFKSEIIEKCKYLHAQKDGFQRKSDIWKMKSETWKSVTESAVVLLSAAVGEGDFSFSQATQLSKQFSYVIEREKEEKEKLINMIKQFGTDGKGIVEIDDDKLQALLALKSILTNAQLLHTSVNGDIQEMVRKRQLFFNL